MLVAAVGCGHCKKAKPEFEATAAKFKDDPKVMFASMGDVAIELWQVELAAVDCTAYPQLCSGLDVKAYPTFLYFNYYNKKQLPYEGGRTVSTFALFLLLGHKF
ncbi:PDIA5 [Cordylochernes scorpioides]|uniref:PDIA5 n=1 Tax=Cordylochernes scorpioides TaxID=51811 RepID=A0ABY6K3Q6_9ARAC|nr:PDIA5 [Cordylochernes scorpioides]